MRSGQCDTLADGRNFEGLVGLRSSPLVYSYSEVGIENLHDLKGGIRMWVVIDMELGA